MGQLIQNMQVTIKRSSTSTILFLFKLLTGLMLGLVFAIAGETAFGYGMFLFTFVIVVMTGIVLKVSKGWGFGGLMLFNLVCLLFGLLLRMYVIVGPGN